jgi:hypothetical protein
MTGSCAQVARDGVFSVSGRSMRPTKVEGIDTRLRDDGNLKLVLVTEPMTRGLQRD